MQGFKRARRPQYCWVLLPVPGSCRWAGSWEEEVTVWIPCTSVAHLIRRFIGLGHHAPSLAEQGGQVLGKG